MNSVSALHDCYITEFQRAAVGAGRWHLERNLMEATVEVDVGYDAETDLLAPATSQVYAKGLSRERWC